MENLKEEAEQLFDDLGLNMTSAITIFLKQSINEQAIPFMINKGNKETLQALKDIKRKENVHGGFSSVEGFNGGFKCLKYFYTNQFKKDFKKAKETRKEFRS